MRSHFSSSQILAVVGIGCLFLVLGCPCDGPGPPDDDLPTVCVEEIRDESVVVPSPELLRDAFSLRKTLEAIVASSNGSGTAESLLASLIENFKIQSKANAAGKTIEVANRSNFEGSLKAKDLLDPSHPLFMFPTGLFNRFDLSAKDGANCGEYRIVYAVPSNVRGRFLLIFEAKLPNPAPGDKIEGCRKVAEFWALLSEEPDEAVRLAKLEQFYYRGLPDVSARVVDHANYGGVLGQVRSNLFIDQRQWRLREHRTHPVEPRFIVDTVKDSPYSPLWATVDPPPMAAGWSQGDRESFQSHLMGEPICNLTRPDRLDSTASAEEIVNGTSAGFSDAFNDFESVSQGSEDDPETLAEAPLRAALVGRLSSIASPLSEAQLLNRAGAMSCGGCHRFSRRSDIGDNVEWPDDAGFVHITESGGLSPALKKFFLPRRREILRNFVCKQSDPVPVDPCRSVRKDSAISEDIVELTARVQEERSLLVGASKGLGEEVAPPRERVKDLEDLVNRLRSAERALPGEFLGARRAH